MQSQRRYIWIQSIDVLVTKRKLISFQFRMEIVQHFDIIHLSKASYTVTLVVDNIVFCVSMSRLLIR